ncbi:MAG: hypothetical protein ABRQ39_26180 [Candidatus Eremiobacterota bacterium]
MCKEEKREELENKLTTVGAQSDKKDLPAFSTNIEKVLLKAVEDEEFKSALLKDRKSALENLELSVTPQDKMILSSVPLDKMEDMIEKFKLQRQSKKKIFKGAAITTALLTSSYLDFYSYYMNQVMMYTLGIRPSCELEIQVAATVSKPLVSLYFSTMLFKIKQNFWRILITASLLIVVNFTTDLASQLLFLFHSPCHDFTYTVYSLLYHTSHIVLFMIFSTIAVKFVLNIKWPQAVGVSITNSVFFLFIIPYLFRTMFIIYWYLFLTIRKILLPGLATLRADPVLVISIIMGSIVVVNIIYRWKKSCKVANKQISP